jgi:hypothetical protein
VTSFFVVLDSSVDPILDEGGTGPILVESDRCFAGAMGGVDGGGCGQGDSSRNGGGELGNLREWFFWCPSFMLLNTWPVVCSPLPSSRKPFYVCRFSSALSWWSETTLRCRGSLNIS